MHKFLTQNQWNPLNLSQKKINTTPSRWNIDENLIKFYRTCMEESWRRKWKAVRKWNVIVWKGILPVYRSTMLTACVFRNWRRSTSSETLCARKNLFVNRTVHDPRRSWTEACAVCNFCRPVRKIADSSYELCRACLSAWNDSAPTGQIFMKFEI